MRAVPFGMVVPAFAGSLSMLSSGRVKCGDRDMFGIWVQKLLSVGSL